MTHQHISKKEMMKRVARFKELKGNSRLFLDTVIPGHSRTLYSIIGINVGEDTSDRPAITDMENFHVAIARAPPGNGAALHSHPTVEAFIPLNGKWSIFWGDEGENEIILNQWDTMSVPPGVMRGFRNVGKEEGHLLGIVSGTDPGRITWSPKVIAEAKKRGLVLDKKGYMAKKAR